MLPPKNLIWSIRLSQYILRLSHAWQRASQANHIVLFDQAFVQVVCSLALLGRAPDEALIAQALDCAPKSDLLIRLDAPYETLETRLRERGRRQSTIERLFELDLNTNLESMRIVDQLDDLLRKRGRSVIRAASLDHGSLRESVERIGKQIDPNLRALHGGTA
jgi:thymidylate kinase